MAKKTKDVQNGNGTAEAAASSGRIRRNVKGARSALSTSKMVAESDTLADLVFERTSNPVTSLQIFSYIAAWGLFVTTYGREPSSIDEIQSGVNVSYPTIARWQSKFKKAFPEYQSPAVLWDIASTEVDATHPEIAALQMGAIQL